MPWCFYYGFTVATRRVHFRHDLHRGHRQGARRLRRQGGRAPRLALQQAQLQEAPLPRGARRHRDPPVRGRLNDVPPRCSRAPTSSRRRASIVVRGTVRARRALRAGRSSSARPTCRWSRAGAGYPITPKEHGTDFLMDHRHLWLRSQAAARDPARAPRRSSRRSATSSTAHGFTLVDAPIFTPERLRGHDARSSRPTTTASKAYLTQSGQLYMEAAATAFGKVYCFGPTFRAEKSQDAPPPRPSSGWSSPRSRSWTSTATWTSPRTSSCYIVAARARRRARQELEVLERDIDASSSSVKTPFPRIPYDEAIEIAAEGRATRRQVRRRLRRRRGDGDLPSSSTGRSSSTATRPS